MLGNGNGNHRSADSPVAAGAGARGAAAPAVAAGVRRKTPWPLVVVAIIFVVVPFLSWYWTTFLRPLDDEQIGQYLSDGDKPRHIQHAIEQIDQRIEKGDPSAARWYPQIIGLVSHPLADVRMSAAWVMGDDARSEEFRGALLRLLEDEEPAVRRMAALSLSRFGEPRARAELTAMLRPYEVRAPLAGTVVTILPAGSEIRRGSLVVRMRDAGGTLREVRAPLAGRIERVEVGEGAGVEAGAGLFVLSPDAENALQSLRALLLVGGAEELAEIERYARGVEGMPADVQKQAALTAGAVKSRVGQS